MINNFDLSNEEKKQSLLTSNHVTFDHRCVLSGYCFANKRTEFAKKLNHVLGTRKTYWIVFAAPPVESSMLHMFVGVCACLKQSLRRLYTIVFCCDLQRRLVVLDCKVHRGASVQ